MPNYNYFPGAYYGTPIPASNSNGYSTTPYGIQQPSYGFDSGQIMNSIVWVQGEAGANAYPVAKGQTIMLMDANPNSNMFYLKSADPYTGRPLPLEKYHYTKIVENFQNDNNSSTGIVETQSFVPREEFDSLKSKLEKLQKTLDELTK